eukprot:4854812-Karenia_brevis.AAC.1
MPQHRETQQLLEADAVEIAPEAPSVQSRVTAFQSSDSVPVLPTRAWLTFLPNSAPSPPSSTQEAVQDELVVENERIETSYE